MAPRGENAAVKKKPNSNGNKYAKYNGSHKTPATPKGTHRKSAKGKKIVGSHRSY